MPSALRRPTACRPPACRPPVFRLGTLAFSLLLSATAWAQSSAVTLTLPAQPLETSIRQLAAQSGARIVYVSDVTADQTAPALNGVFTVDEALDRLLAGSPLALRRTADGSYTIVRPEPGVSTLSPVLVAGNLERPSESTGDYTVDTSTSATRLRLSARETPQSVSVVTRQRMDDQGMVTLTDALKSTTGVKVHESEVFGTTFEVRGFSLDAMQVDGVPLTLGTGRSEPGLDLALYDRVEVTRGAAGLLQGAGNPGGTLNMVRKQPTSTLQASASARVGSWNQYRIEADVAGPLNERGDLRGRFIAAHEDGDSFVDYVNERKEVVSGTLQYDVTRDVTVTLGLDHQRTSGLPQGTGLVFYSDGGDIGLPRSTYLGTSWNSRDTRSTALTGNLQWNLGNGWEARVAGTRQWYKSDAVFMSASGQGVDRETGLGPFLRYANRTHADRAQTSLDAFVSGPFTLLGREHELVVGANTRMDPTTVDRGELPGYDHIRPNVHSWDPSVPPPPEWKDYYSRSDSRTRQTGIYSVARFRVAEPLTLIAGGRWSWWKYTTQTQDLEDNSPAERDGYSKRGVFTPYGGLVFDLDTRTSLYASYTDVFRPQNAIDRNGGYLKPVVGANYEAGIKREFADGRMNASLAVFRINESNRAQTDLDGPQPCPYTESDYCSIAAGKVRSQGVEAEISGELAPGWRIYAGHTYNTTRYVKDANNAGQTFNSRTPEHMFKLFTSYRLPGALNAWTVGGGVYWQTKFVYQNSSGSIRIEQPPYAVADAMVRYDITPRVSATLNINNLFDKRYYRYISHERAYNYYGAPRNVMLTLRARY